MNTIEKSNHSIDRKWRNRRHQTAGSLILALNSLTSDFTQAAENTMDIRKSLHSAKTTLREAIAEVKKLQAEVNEKKARCEEHTMELQNAINEVKTTDLYEYNERENSTLNDAVWFAEIETLKLQRAIQITENELTTHKVIIRNKKPLEQKHEPAITGPMKLPNIDVMGVIAETGSINVDRHVKCCICLTNAVNCVFYRCGHMCCCFTCGTDKLTRNRKSKLRVCPVCRSDVKKVIKTYK